MLDASPDEPLLPLVCPWAPASWCVYTWTCCLPVRRVLGSEREYLFGHMRPSRPTGWRSRRLLRRGAWARRSRRLGFCNLLSSWWFRWWLGFGDGLPNCWWLGLGDGLPSCWWLCDPLRCAAHRSARGRTRRIRPWPRFGYHQAASLT